ncbi:MAG: tRNA dihydrouridine(20/20a) synthase DusA [Rhizobiaceae bacterium]
MYHKSLKNKEKIFAIAPMMDWTDRHCRYFHRQLTKRALLYTEMVVADAVIHGDRQKLIGFDPIEHPVALQLGGSEPAKLAEAAGIAADYGYDEINLNVGCPSDRVQSGTFGACLMREPHLVADCVEAMKQAVSIPVTVKCRTGVDEQKPGEALWAIANLTFDAGSDALWVHARKAWLQGLSPKENREIPPLEYDVVYRLKNDFPRRFIGINGGIQSLGDAAAHLEQADGVMLGRAAYQMPAILADVDRRFYGAEDGGNDLAEIVEIMADYASGHIAKGGRLIHVTRHMTGLFHGVAGARSWRRILAEEGTRPGAGAETLRLAFDAVKAAGAMAA